MSAVKLPHLNKIFLVGRLVRDPEFKQTKGGVSALDARLAASSTYEDDKGNWREEVVFVDFAVRGRLAGLCAEFLHKGYAVLVEGRLQNAPLDTKRELRVVADRVQFLEKTR